MTFGMVPEGYEHAVGLVQVRAIASEILSGGVGICVRLSVLGHGPVSRQRENDRSISPSRHTAVNRLEARAVVQNGRGNGALRKLGAVQEGVLRGSLLKDGKYPRSDHVVDHRAGLVPGEVGLGHDGELNVIWR